MNDLPELNEADIRAWTDPRSFQRGQRYFRAGHILNPHRDGPLLRARCTGSCPSPYAVQVSLGPTGILAADCSCPVGHGGHCKHVVALLLAWVNDPNAFSTAEDLDSALQTMSKVQLVDLVRRMLDRCPELESFLELPIVTGEGSPTPIDGKVIRRHARDAFTRTGRDGWGRIHGVAQELLGLVGIGDECAEADRWRDAATVYQIVMEETLEGHPLLGDESGYLHGVVDRCVAGLAPCLDAEQQPSRRQGILNALFRVYRWDIAMGGIEMGFHVPDVILEQAGPEERRLVAGWVRETLPEDSLWARPTCGQFLLQLEEPWLDDEAYLRICRDTGLDQELVERLLARGRVDEAVAAARQAPVYKLPGMADIFVAHGRDREAHTLVRQRAQSSGDARLIQWLKERALARGDRDEALALTETLFWQRPALERYQELRTVARPTGQWDRLRQAVLARLMDEKHALLLIEITLDEGDVDGALETLEGMRGTPRWRWVSERRIASVARAAEEKRPREATRLHIEIALRLIARRGRGNYAVAAKHLERVRGLCWHLDDGAAWQTFIAGLREAHRRLPALQDELDKAGL